jgi:hypothetical protein
MTGLPANSLSKGDGGEHRQRYHNESPGLHDRKRARYRRRTMGTDSTTESKDDQGKRCRLLRAAALSGDLIWDYEGMLRQHTS